MSRELARQSTPETYRSMDEFRKRGDAVRESAKSLVIEFMRASDVCQPGREGMRLASMFRACGFDWGDYPKATSSNQQYWIVALVQELEREGLVERVSDSGPYRLRK